ncbi:hypothetical protein IF2G_10839 [Cordyceps javanica]|nr:hypothetical protein IF2G_10839 [Cordyceps javanica]
MPMQIVTPRRANCVLVLGADPWEQFSPLYEDSGTTVAQCIRTPHLCLVGIQALHHPDISQFRDLSRVLHRNIVKPLCFYQHDDTFYIVHEIIGKKICDILPLSINKARSIMRQVHYSFQTEMFVRIKEVRITIGEITDCIAVLDWDHELSVDSNTFDANYEYIASYILDLMGLIGQFITWDASALQFIHALQSGTLSLSQNTFLPLFDQAFTFYSPKSFLTRTLKFR